MDESFNDIEHCIACIWFAFHRHRHTHMLPHDGRMDTMDWDVGRIGLGSGGVGASSLFDLCLLSQFPTTTLTHHLAMFGASHFSHQTYTHTCAFERINYGEKYWEPGVTLVAFASDDALSSITGLWSQWATLAPWPSLNRSCSIRVHRRCVIRHVESSKWCIQPCICPLLLL